ncbi:MAG: DNA-formamidopyrimidine glycosylase [Chloroflexota bacterium]
MPELPEVETVVRGLRQPLTGRTVRSMWQDCARTIRFADPDEFAARITGQTFRSISRRAKYILCQLDHDLLVVHLRMTGRLYVVPDDLVSEADRWLHFSLQLDNGTQLRFSDARKFGIVALTPSFDLIAPALGPEPLGDDFTPEILRERLARHGKNIKALLLDQAFVAGVGNIYADEALHRAQISPLRPANQLIDPEIRALHAAIRDALNAGIIQEGASVSWYRKADGTTGEAQNYLHVYGRDGESCERCGETIVKIRVAQRGTHYCPACQT